MKTFRNVVKMLYLNSFVGKPSSSIVATVVFGRSRPHSEEKLVSIHVVNPLFQVGRGKQIPRRP
jgi:hypothetical protein